MKISQNEGKTIVDFQGGVLLKPSSASYALSINSETPIGIHNLFVHNTQPSLRGRLRAFWLGVKVAAVLAFKGRPYWNPDEG